MKLHETFPLKIFTPFQTFFEGEALALSAANKTGPFDILAKHEDFLSILVPCSVVVQTTAGKKEFPLERGIIQVNKDQVWVFANI
jgi:F0F1-type ATP synthase epsilon subunit